jgi:hypothetical protein
LHFEGPQVENLRNGRQECLRYAGANVSDATADGRAVEKIPKRRRLINITGGFKNNPL